MLHHYNYASPLSHFLSYHQLHEQNECSNGGQTTPNSMCEDLAGPLADSRYKSASNSPTGKSFTIAAILGLKPDGNERQNGPADLTTAVVNLSVHQGMTMTMTPERGPNVSDCSRLQLPVLRGGHQTTAAAAGGVPPGGGYSPPSATGPCHQQQRTVRTLKQVTNNSSSNGINGKKPSNSKSKRVRTIFTPEQLERLEAEFERQQYMVGPERLYLAHTLQLTEAQVKVWFQNRRIKWRKHHLEITHQRLAAIKQQQLQQQLLGETNTDTMDSNNSSNTDT